MDKNTNWPEFIKLTLDTPPRWLLKKALELCDGFSGHAIDLGCGSGLDTIALAKHGWTVTAVDSTPDGFENIQTKLPTELQDRVRYMQASFEDVDIPEADLVYSAFSVPFCRPEYFDQFWGKIVRAIKPGGRFCGNLFGVKDEWAYMTDATFITKERFDALFDGFEIEHFREQYSEGPSVLVPTKLWHLFDVVAKKS
ncbi:MAG: methyltransferase domain-containing protein [Oscillospiraceae bacterium]|nr:methyltransferase domain-containing protein [Oscillospiraceae bacterium]